MSQLSKLEDISDSIKAFAIQTEPTSMYRISIWLQNKTKKNILIANLQTIR